MANKTCWVSISKPGDIYRRTLLIHGARSVIYRAQHKPDACSWINGLVNKNARIVWALLVKDRPYASTYPAQCGSAV